MPCGLPRFYETEEEFQTIRQRLKLWICPCCGRGGFFILNGVAVGYAESSSERQIRGHRIICSRRRTAEKGCGMTFTILLTSVLKGLSISAQTIWGFLDNISKGTTTIAAFRAVQATTFSDRTVHRMRSRFLKNQFTIRTKLRAVCQVPATQSPNPIAGLINHLCAAFLNHPCPVSAFQIRFQTSFF